MNKHIVFIAHSMVLRIILTFCLEFLEHPACHTLYLMFVLSTQVVFQSTDKDVAQSVLSGMREACATSYQLAALKKKLHGHLYIHCVKSYTSTLILSGATWEAETILREVHWLLIVLI